MHTKKWKGKKGRDLFLGNGLRDNGVGWSTHKLQCLAQLSTFCFPCLLLFYCFLFVISLQLKCVMTRFGSLVWGLVRGGEGMVKGTLCPWLFWWTYLPLRLCHRATGSRLYLIPSVLSPKTSPYQSYHPPHSTLYSYIYQSPDIYSPNSISSPAPLHLLNSASTSWRYQVQLSLLQSPIPIPTM